MDREKIMAVGIDYDATLQRFAGNEMLFEKFLMRYENDVHYMEGKKAFDKGDYDEVLKQVHALKGITGTLGMNSLYEEASRVVEIIRGNEEGDVAQAMDALGREHEKIMELFV